VRTGLLNLPTVPTDDAKKLEGARVLILNGPFKGSEGICLGEVEAGGLFAVSPDESEQTLQLAFERDFGLLIDLSATPENN
jgi:hypothetical protein